MSAFLFDGWTSYIYPHVLARTDENRLGTTILVPGPYRAELATQPYHVGFQKEYAPKSLNFVWYNLWWAWLGRTMAGKREVLQLYRAILRQGRTLRYTDGDYFRRKVRQEFRRWKGTKNPAEIQFQIEVGLQTSLCIEYYEELFSSIVLSLPRKPDIF